MVNVLLISRVRRAMFPITSLDLGQDRSRLVKTRSRKISNQKMLELKILTLFFSKVILFLKFL